jgi:hypothetical protein
LFPPYSHGNADTSPSAVTHTLLAPVQQLFVTKKSGFIPFRFMPVPGFYWPCSFFAGLPGTLFMTLTAEGCFSFYRLHHFAPRHHNAHCIQAKKSSTVKPAFSKLPTARSRALFLSDLKFPCFSSGEAHSSRHPGTITVKRVKRGRNDEG